VNPNMSDPVPNVPSSGPRELATLGGGCFWCTEAIFSDLVGVESVLPGYAGGKAPNPSYEAVCGGNTGHAEVVQLTFDPQSISFKDILRVFFTVHDPTTKNRQGADVGTQYRSVILFHDPVQKAQAGEVIHEIDEAQIWKKPIVTELAPFTVFYPAEDYHRNYFLRNPESSYCQLVVAPKVAKFRKQFVDRLRSRQDQTHPPIRASH
jgi:peptide-methionine (S)-S-oxide reductase